MPALQHAPTTSWHPAEVMRCFRLKLWDPEQEKMITLRELRDSLKSSKPIVQEVELAVAD